MTVSKTVSHCLVVRFWSWLFIFQRRRRQNSDQQSHGLPRHVGPWVVSEVGVACRPVSSSTLQRQRPKKSDSGYD
jgi:hypothetical protein